MRRWPTRGSCGSARVAVVAAFSVVFVGALAADAAAQTAPLPAVASGDRSGLLTRGAFFISLAGLQTDDPRFSLAQRSRADVDLVGYGKGRVNFLMDAELVMG